MTEPYDAILIVSFGGPEKREDVIPFLENVLRGKPVPRERLLEVAEHYYHFGGVSPINAQVRELITCLKGELLRAGIELPVYWGNRNWDPLLTDTLRQMSLDGIKRGLAFFTSAYSSYSGCRQYRENIQQAQSEVGPGAPVIDKIRVFYNHPDFIGVSAERVAEAINRLPEAGRDTAVVAFTAHSIPLSMADHCDYVAQLTESCRLVAAELKLSPDRWKLVYQSRSGRPSDPWLEPDILDHIRKLHTGGISHLVIAPIGFLSDHIEILFDLDEQAKELCAELNLSMTRAGTVGTHPRFVAMIRELIQERLGQTAQRRSLGNCGPSHDVCPVDCCRYPLPAGRPSRTS